MPASDQLVTSLPQEAPASGDAFWYVKDPAGAPAARRCTGSQLFNSFASGANVRFVLGYLEIYVEGLDQWYQLHARLNDDEVPELYLQAPVGIGGEGGELLGGEGGEIVGGE